MEALTEGTHQQMGSMHKPFEDRSHEHSPIKSQRDYRKALREIEDLMGAKRNTLEGDRLDVLVTLVEAWERKHYPMDHTRGPGS